MTSRGASSPGNSVFLCLWAPSQTLFLAMPCHAVALLSILLPLTWDMSWPLPRFSDIDYREVLAERQEQPLWFPPADLPRSNNPNSLLTLVNWSNLLSLLHCHVCLAAFPNTCLPMSIISPNSLNLPFWYILGLIQQHDHLIEQCFSPSLAEPQCGRQELGSILALGPGMARTRRPPYALGASRQNGAGRGCSAPWMLLHVISAWV